MIQYCTVQNSAVQIELNFLKNKTVAAGLGASLRNPLLGYGSTKNSQTSLLNGTEQHRLFFSDTRSRSRRQAVQLAPGMNAYAIAPKMVRIHLDKQLSEQFATLNSTLQWHPLTTNLDSCERPPNIYFRITLKARQGDTFAGFCSGAPFMLTRDIDVQKRAFFLRHWVRRVSPQDPLNPPFTVLRHMAVGAMQDRLLIRINIDRPLDNSDIFKSVPFATWMFQVAQVDAIIHEMSHIRLGFAIERTVTSEERLLISKGRADTAAPPTSLDSTTPTSNPTPTPIPVPIPIPTPSSAPNSTPILAPSNTNTPSTQSVGANASPPAASPRSQRSSQQSPMHAPPMQQNMLFRAQYNPTLQTAGRPRAPTPVLPHNPYNPYAYISARHNQTASLQPAHMHRPSGAAAAIRPAATRGYNRTPTLILPTAATPAGQGTSHGVLPSVLGPGGPTPMPTEHPRSVVHPYLRVWENRDPEDPYEPFFLTEDVKFQQNASKTLLVDPEDDVQQNRYDELIGNPNLHFGNSHIVPPQEEPDVLVTVPKHQPARAVGSDAIVPQPGPPADYSTTVKAAVDYNHSLVDQREELNQWMLEDEQQENEDSDDDEAEDDDDSSTG